jgi:hypothetical protein
MSDANKIYQYVAVPKEFWEELMQKLDILLENKQEMSGKLVDFYDEAEVKEILGKKTTAMWELKKSGRLPYYKVGNKTYYKKEHIMTFIENSKQ